MEPRGRPPYRIAGVVLLVLLVALSAVVYGQFRGAFSDRMTVTLRADRAGLVMEPGAKVTYNGVAVGRVADVDSDVVNGVTTARLLLELDPRLATAIPANVVADITATTVFGNKYVSFTSPKRPSPQHISSTEPITVRTVSTEFNTLFQTILSISEKVDPVRLNTTLSAAAEGLTGLGGRFGRSLTDANLVLGDLNPQLPQLHQDVRALTALADTYVDASPDLWTALDNAVTTARTVDGQRGEVDAALLASVGFGNTGADIVGRAEPYLIRGAADMVTTTGLLDEYSPSLFCTLRNYAEVAPRVADALGGNGYSLASASGAGAEGAEAPYIYPDNLPRLGAKGGPGGRPGCWQSITRELWPAPYLVMDTGASIAPYNHLELGQPMFNEYIWGRQVGEYTINP